MTGAEKKIRVIEMIDDASIGGGQVHVLLLSKYLPRDRFDVTIACEGSGYLVEEAKKAGIRTIAVAMSNRLRMRSVADMYHLFQGSPADIVHTHGGTAGFWGRIGSTIFGTGAKRIHTYHGIHYLNTVETVSVWFRHIDRFLLRMTDQIICVCQSDVKKGMSVGIVPPEKTSVIPYGIETGVFRKNSSLTTLRQELNIDPSTFLFGHIGRLHVQKGQKYLLQAFHLMNKECPNSKLVMIGDGELRDELTGMAQELGISDKIYFLGARTNPAEYLAIFDCFVLPSLWEGQPISLLEAMVAGKPIIATTVDGINDILIDGKNALLVPSTNSEILARSMVRMCQDSALAKRLAEEAQRTVAAGYAIEHMCDQIARLYERLYSDAMV